MKNFLKNGALILLSIAILYIIFLRECKKTTCPPDGYVLIWGATWDSVNKMLLKPPEIIIKKEYIKGQTVYVDRPVPVPVPDPVDSTVNCYSDSLVNEKINVWVDFKLRGELLDWRWKYIPITKQITLEKIKYVPQIVDRPVPVPKNGLYLSAVAGGNTDAFLFGASADLITKQDYSYGIQFQRFGNQNFYSFRLGSKLRL